MGSGSGPRSTRRRRGGYVNSYFASTGARQKYPGLTYTVATRGTTVLVRVRAPMDLPLRLPGVGEGTVVTGTAASVVVIAD